MRSNGDAEVVIAIKSVIQEGRKQNVKDVITEMFRGLMIFGVERHNYRSRSRRWSLEGYRYATKSGSCWTSSSRALREVTDMRRPELGGLELKVLWREVDVVYPFVVMSSCAS